MQLSICVFACQIVCLCDSLRIWLFVRVFAYRGVRLLACLCVLRVCLVAFVFVCSVVALLVWFSVCLRACLLVCLIAGWCVRSLVPF